MMCELKVKKYFAKRFLFRGNLTLNISNIYAIKRLKEERYLNLNFILIKINFKIGVTTTFNIASEIFFLTKS